MHKIVILYFESTPLSSIATPLDIFLSAGVMWNSFTGKTKTQEFEVTLATISGNNVNCSQDTPVTPHCSIDDIQKTDVVFISPVIPVDLPADAKSKLTPWLIRMHQRGTILASICSGAFLLAETGLLDDKIATTHWALADRFRQEFPLVDLQIHTTVADNGNLLCSGGANAGADLCLHIIRRLCSNEVAFQCAKALVLDPRRHSQSPYQVFNFDKSHGDKQIADAQEWIEKHHSAKFSVESLASRFGVGRRTFERRFKAVTGHTPLKYIQKVRVESAKLLLEIGEKSFEEITLQVGYEDSSGFRKRFIKTTGITPGQYRRKFMLH